MGSVGFRHDAKCKDKVLPGSKGNRGKLSWWLWFLIQRGLCGRGVGFELN